MRQKMSLSGTWDFQLDPEGTLSPASLDPDREIQVPLPWQVPFPDLARYSGFAWYRRSVVIDEDWLKGELLVRFGAVDYWCRVFVNGQPAGEHEGGYTPFELPIKEHVHPGTNEIVVQVYDSVQQSLPVARWPRPQPREERPGPPFNAEDVPHGKQEWYINVGGIWQDVELIAVPTTYIDTLHVATDIKSGRAKINLELDGEPAGSDGGSVRLSLLAGGREVGRAEIPLASGQRKYMASIQVGNPRLWTTEDPYLYTLSATLAGRGGEDTLGTRFGFREISTGGGKILLNGEPLFLLCALDQDLYPDTIYTVPSEEFLRDQFEKAKHLGLNSLRCHIKPPDPRYLDLADETGLLIWAEIPSWRTFHNKPTLFPDQVPVTDAIKHRVEKTLEEMVRRDFNHPSLVIWTIVNEDWGTSLPLCADDRRWVAQMYERCKELDPTRLVVDNSACPHPWGPNIHVHSDLDDFHIYANIPDRARSFEEAIEQFGLRPLWTYSNNGDAIRTGNEPLVLSEFGNWGLPSIRTVREHYGGDPAWFEIGAWWSPWEGEAAWANGTEDRFRALGLDSIWRDYEEFATATQWHQYGAMKFEIEAIRRQPTLAGYVITEFTDAYWESNGLLDFARNPKVYYDHFAAINSPDVVVPQVEHYATWDDRPVRVRVSVAHYSPDTWEGATLRWQVGGGDSHGEVTLPTLERGEVRQVRAQSIRMPAVEQRRTVRVDFAVTGAGGAELARNSLDILVLPSALRQARYQAPVAVIGEDRDLTTMSSDLSARPPEEMTGHEEPPLDLESLPEPTDPGEVVGPRLGMLMRRYGYQVSEGLDRETQVAVTNYPNAELLRWVRDGGNLFFISSGASPFFWAQYRGGAYSGSWITSFTWLRHDAHARLKAANPLGMPFSKIMPSHTLLGLPFDDPRFQGDYLSGMVSGWVHHPSVHTVQFRYGRGKVIMTTFSLERGLLQGDPAAVAMLHDLIEYLCSGKCRPSLAANFQSSL